MRLHFGPKTEILLTVLVCCLVGASILSSHMAGRLPVAHAQAVKFQDLTNPERLAYFEALERKGRDGQLALNKALSLQEEYQLVDTSAMTQTERDEFEVEARSGLRRARAEVVSVYGRTVTPASIRAEFQAAEAARQAAEAAALRRLPSRGEVDSD